MTVRRQGGDPGRSPRPTAEPPPDAGDRRRVGGRFWALAGSDDDDADEDGAEPPGESPPSPTPSDLICEFFHSGYSEEEVATTVDKVVPRDDLAREGLHDGEKIEIVRRIVHRKTAPSALRPWKGPLPKVCLPKLTVFDLIRPDAWVTVKRKKGRRLLSRNVRPPAPAMEATATEIRSTRATALAQLLGAAGLDREPSGLVANGPDNNGYEAHYVYQGRSVECFLPCTSDPSIVPAQSVRAARVHRQGSRGFPQCGSGRARRIPPLLMAGRGAGPPPAASTAGGGLEGLDRRRPMRRDGAHRRPDSSRRHLRRVLQVVEALSSRGSSWALREFGLLRRSQRRLAGQRIDPRCHLMLLGSAGEALALRRRRRRLLGR